MHLKQGVLIIYTVRFSYVIWLYLVKGISKWQDIFKCRASCIMYTDKNEDLDFSCDTYLDFLHSVYIIMYDIL